MNFVTIALFDGDFRSCMLDAVVTYYLHSKNLKEILTTPEEIKHFIMDQFKIFYTLYKAKKRVLSEFNISDTFKHVYDHVKVDVTGNINFDCDDVYFIDLITNTLYLSGNKYEVNERYSYNGK